jgi:hypothetical protein
MPATRTVGAAVALVTVAALVAACGAATEPSATSPTASSTASRSTATVTRSDLVSSTTNACELGHGESTPIVARTQGTLTASAPVGSVVGQGDVLYALDTRPVVRLSGPVPAWRDLGPASTDGTDVRQLERALVDLGYADGLGLTVDMSWTVLTTVAVKRWQKALGEAQSGTVRLGDVVFTPQVLRVVERTAGLGSPVQPGQPVLGVGSTRQLVSCTLRTGQASLAPVGATAHLTLPGGSTADGTVTSSQLVTLDDEQQLAVSISAPAKAVRGLLDGAAVQVVLDEVVATDVLVVPVTALVALSDGGYGLEQVLADGSTRYVPVTAGAFAGTAVEVSGDAVAQGDEVVVTP